jgi:hypothetical protein
MIENEFKAAMDFVELLISWSLEMLALSVVFYWF